MPDNYLEEDPAKICHEMLNDPGSVIERSAQEPWWMRIFLKQLSEKISAQNQAINYLLRQHQEQVQQGDSNVNNHTQQG